MSCKFHFASLQAPKWDVTYKQDMLNPERSCIISNNGNGTSGSCSALSKGPFQMKVALPLVADSIQVKQQMTVFQSCAHCSG